MTLVWRPGWNGLTEPEAVEYVAAVEAADGQDLEFGVARAINDFVLGCKNDGIWDAIKACCILAGARTLGGALVPLVGTAPTNANFSEEVDPDWSNVSLLLRGEGADGGTTFTDSSSNTLAATVTASNVLSTKASSGKFGSGISYVDTGINSARILYNNPVQLQFGTGDFTWEAWIRPDAAPSAGFYNMLWDSRASGESLTNRFYADFYANGDNKARAIVAGTVISTSSLSVGQWYHFAVCRSSGVSRVFLNGVLQGSVSDSSNYSNGTSRPVLFNNLNFTQRGVGYSVDEIRITKGVARYTSDFTIPATAFPGSSSDYSRNTGLVGDGSTKYLNSNRNNNADPQNSKHLSVFVSTESSVGNTTLIGQALATGSSHLSVTVNAGNPGYDCRVNGPGITNTGTRTTGFAGLNRSVSTGFVIRSNSSTSSLLTSTSATPATGSILVFNGINFNAARLAFYSIGESLDLALLDTRVTDLINAIGAAIP